MSWIRYGNWSVKLLLVVLLLVGLMFPDLPQFSGKAWPLRVVFYPLVAAVVPVIWLIRKPAGRYPYLADTLLVMPFLTDTVGNVANLFDPIPLTDDLLHLVNWMFLVGAMMVVLRPLGLPKWNRILLGTGSGALAIVVWEIIEFLIAKSGITGLNLTYGDTIGDLAMSTMGGALGATLVVLLGIGEPDSRKLSTDLAPRHRN